MLTCSFNEVALPSFQACSGALHVNKTGSNMARPERLGDLGDTTQVSTISKAPLLSGVRRGPGGKDHRAPAASCLVKQENVP